MYCQFSQLNYALPIYKCIDILNFTTHNLIDIIVLIITSFASC